MHPIRRRQRRGGTRVIASVPMEDLEVVRQARGRADGPLGAGHVNAPGAIGAPLPGVGEAVP